MKLVWDNGKPTRAVSDLRCEQGRWTPRTPDATEQTFKHTMGIGVLNMQAENMHQKCRQWEMRQRINRARNNWLNQQQKMSTIDKT
jgi:hypothetical protein